MSDEFFLNLDRIKNSTEFPAVVTSLAWKINAETYVMPGDWFKRLHDEDLTILSRMCEAIQTMGREAEMTEELFAQPIDTGPLRNHYCLLLLSMMLYIAEGVGDGVIKSMADDDTNERLVKLLMTYVSVESLHRKGLAEAVHENFTFDITADNVVAKPTQKGIDLARKLRGE